jgi:hypothetical protein
MENFVPLPYGGAVRRPAIENKFASVDDDQVRLIPFVFSVSETYLLVLGDQEINIYQDTTLKDTVVAPWSETELNDIKFVQSADVMWLVHPNYAIQRLQRNADTDWSIADEAFDYPPFQDENDEEIYFDLTFSETAWVTSTAYVEGDIVQYDGVVYRCILAHTSAATLSIDYNAGYWIASNNGVSATLNSYDAITAGSNANYFTSDMVGSRFLLKNTRNSARFFRNAAPVPIRANYSEYSTNLNGTSPSVADLSAPINASYSNWKFEATPPSSATWSGTIIIERSTDSGVTWEDYVNVITVVQTQSKALSLSSDEEEGGNTWLRFRIENYVVGGGLPDFTLSVDDTEILGIVEITAFTDAHTVDVNIISDVQQELSAGITVPSLVQDGAGTGALTSTRTKKWSMEAFNGDQGYPRAIALFENRLCYAGSDTFPDRVFMSRIDDFTDFQPSTVATGAIDLTLNSGGVDAIQWMVPQAQLIIGTSGSEWSLGAADERKAISPTSFDLKRRTTYGSSSTQGVLVNSAVLFLMRQGRKVREWTFQWDAQDYVAPDLSILAEHITDGGVTQSAYQQQPDNVLWSIRSDGTLLGFTYERDQNVIGWHRHANDEFEFESVAVLPRANEEDEVWVSVKITVNSVIKRYIGRLNDREWGTNYLTEWQGSDFYTTYTSPGTATLTGLGYLEGETVTVVADGVVKSNEVVSGGQITIDSDAYTTVVVGLPFTSTMAPIYLESEFQFGSSQGTKKDVRTATIRFKDTFSAKVTGDLAGNLDLVKFDPDETPLFNGDWEAWFDNESEFLKTCYIVQDQPMPCQVLAMIPNVEGRR